MKSVLKHIQINSVNQLPGMLTERAEINRNYMMSLKNENLLQNFYQEAGLLNEKVKLEHIHWGWETPTCQLRGHFLGHWLSAAALRSVAWNDLEMKAKADKIVSELARCQQINGGEWIGSIPEKYLDMLAEGHRLWAPQYTLHKTLMGLWHMYAFAGNDEALVVLKHSADWFYRWTDKLSTVEMSRILDMETGGMLEIWADLYAVTGDTRHLELLNRYYRPSLFDRLLKGEDALTNQHANTTVPEVLGTARAWEVTGEQKWRDIVEAYWKQAVTERGYFCTGGQTMGEIWTPPGMQSARLGEKNQEHCTVYNMMRLADKLLQWTGDVSYADYWERNFINGVLAQQNAKTGQIAYFLPLHAGAVKRWGSYTEDFWCCHGTLVQAHAAHSSCTYYETEQGAAVCQYIPSVATLDVKDSRVTIDQKYSLQTEYVSRPDTVTIEIRVRTDKPVEFVLDLRIPWWVQPSSTLIINGKSANKTLLPSSFIRISRIWQDDIIQIRFVKKLTTCPLPDANDMVAFMDGPVVLAGLCTDERTLYGHVDQPNTMIVPDAEREWVMWRNGYRTVNIDHGFRLIPLNEICDEQYQVYFPIRSTPSLH